MKALVEKSTGRVIVFNQTVIELGGTGGQQVRNGTAVWVDLPSGASPEDIESLAGNPPIVRLDAAKKAAKDAEKAAKDAAKAALNDLKDVTDPAAKRVLQAIVDLVGL